MHKTVMLATKLPMSTAFILPMVIKFPAAYTFG
jgi:hypothetical protein